jgi:hypothetical protein
MYIYLYRLSSGGGKGAHELLAGRNTTQRL